MSKDKLYVIMRGEYSDKEPVTVVESLEDAVNYCAAHNVSYGDAILEDLWYVAVDKPEAIPAVTGTFMYRNAYFKWGGKWRVENSLEVFKNSVMRTDHAVDTRAVFKGKTELDIHVTIWREWLDPERAFKVIQDIAYQKIAEREGVAS